MAVSFDTWRKAHGFSEADAPDPNEVALRLALTKGMIDPNMTNGIIGAFAPEIMKMVRDFSQSQSVAPIPPDLEAALSGQPEAPVEGEAPAEEVPAEETPAGPGLAEPEV
jgi:hypothetical protein